MKKIKLIYDVRKGEHGSKEIYWHFMLGYLLPSINFYTKETSKLKEENIFLIYDDCGPKMNVLIKELATLLNIKYSINNGSKKNYNFDESVYVSRWDKRLKFTANFMSNTASYKTNIKFNKFKFLQKSFINDILEFKKDPLAFKLKKDILFTRNLIISKINNLEIDKRPAYLFLERSDVPKYYSKDGKAKIKGYGKSRRRLLNLDEECENQNNNGFNAKVFEPGNCTLIEQIKTFYNSNGIVAIRGSELLNMIWLRKNCKVFVIGFDKPAIHLYNYSSILNLKLIEKYCNTKFPDLKQYNLKKYL